MLPVPDLFPEPLPDGIIYVPEFVDAVTESNLVLALSQGQWDYTYKRRRKHFGKEYAAVGGAPKQGVYPGSLPGWLRAIALKLQKTGYFSEVPKHSLINEYLPGQGIADHTDADDGVTIRVASLSLGSGAEMRFTEPNGRRHFLYLEPRSLVVFEGAVATDWHHGIPARLSDRIGGLIIERARRVSLTFRENASNY
ncbi:MAG: alpha-ketoglutarate-dependent dioxygenase AlkB [Pseudomonadota bacterium]